MSGQSPWVAFGVVATFSACASLAGIDGDYTIGDSSMAGSGPAGSSTVGPGAGGAATGGAGAGAGVGGDGSGVGGASAGGTGGMPPTSNRQVSCNGQPCGVGEVCCATANPGTENNTQNMCAPQGGCLPGQFEIKCDGPEDCMGGEVCCGRWPNGYYDHVECTTANDCQIDNDDYIMCLGNGGPSNTLCVNGGTCFSSSDLVGYYYCG